MRELQAWFSANSLQMNEAKTNFMLAGTKNHVKKTTGFTLDIDGSVVHASNKLKFLGVVIDAHLSWEAHISQVVKKCNYILVSFYRLRQYFTKEVMKLIMEAFVFPHLYYCLCAWGGATKIQLRKIQKLINFATRIVTGLKKHEHIWSSLSDLNWPKIEHLVEERDLSKVFRLLTDPMTPTAIRDLLVPCADISSRTTRASQSGVLRLPRRRLTGSQRSFSFRAAAGWNALPQAARTALLLDASKRATLWSNDVLSLCLCYYVSSYHAGPYVSLMPVSHEPNIKPLCGMVLLQYTQYNCILLQVVDYVSLLSAMKIVSAVLTNWWSPVNTY